MNQLEVHHGAATDVGLVREVNEDSHLSAPPVWVVADGMGGHDGGDVASRMVVEEFSALGEREYDPAGATAAVTAALSRAQDRIAAYSAEHRAAGQPHFHSGTTAVIAVLVRASHGPQWLLANLGDSRAYRFFDGTLTQVSVDHSVVQELVDAGSITPEDAAVHPDRNVVTRALGGGTPVDPDFFHLTVPAGMRLLLCSDGVSGMLDADQIASVLGETPDPRDAAERLVLAAVAEGGRDNATAIVIDVVGWSDENPYDSERQRASLEQKLGVLP
ncbi:PP2C family protein-serine/threonine phosphatase [Nocardioides insulae]|uniref:PP2C family protein-serine/threonine phosphatase n=1 Tax=Nocardioides insulae TaxID=394734 RepID=UPI00042419AD|nr:protein phosphatase 2C domain-containing protein [Nocardioides insulae]